MSDRVIECASRAGRDFSEFMKGEKGMMEALASVDEFGEQLRLNGCVNHHFVSYMMRNSIMQAFMDMAKAEKKEERRRKRAEAKRSRHYKAYLRVGLIMKPEFILGNQLRQYHEATQARKLGNNTGSH